MIAEDSVKFNPKMQNNVSNYKFPAVYSNIILKHLQDKEQETVKPKE